MAVLTINFIEMKKIVNYFDKLEDRIRAKLSRYPVTYAVIGGVAIVIFWRGVWEAGDILHNMGGFWGFLFYAPNTIVWSSLILLLTGLFVSFFVGDRIILSGVKHEKRVDEKTEQDIRNEEEQVRLLREKIKLIAKDVEEIKMMLGGGEKKSEQSQEKEVGKDESVKK